MKHFSPFVKAHLLFLILALPLVMLDKGTVELWLNARHTPFLDSFFRYTTVVGDGITAALFALILLTFSYYKTIVYTTAILLNTFLDTGWKKGVVLALVRPKNFFPDDVTLNFVENFKTYGYQTFPSGHTGAAFTWLSFLALLLPKIWPPAVPCGAACWHFKGVSPAALLCGYLCRKHHRNRRRAAKQVLFRPSYNVRRQAIPAKGPDFQITLPHYHSPCRILN
ncbi:MAG: hypothetical protein U5L09_02645 [Bacteroidales bacterium]|nr:hypothetical protein [Bacteroidales bacterium]